MTPTDADMKVAKVLQAQLLHRRILREMFGPQSKVKEDREKEVEIIAATIAQARDDERTNLITPDSRTTAENVYRRWIMELQDPVTRIGESDAEWLRTVLALVISQVKVKAAFASIDSTKPPNIAPLVWCKGKRAAPPGHIIDDAGVVRKVVGTLPITADGCVANIGSFVWNTDQWSNHGKVHMREDDTVGAYFGTQWRPIDVCYSTREAAEPSRKRGCNEL